MKISFFSLVLLVHIGCQAAAGDERTVRDRFAIDLWKSTLKTFDGELFVYERVGRACGLPATSGLSGIFVGMRRIGARAISQDPDARSYAVHFLKEMIEDEAINILMTEAAEGAYHRESALKQFPVLIQKNIILILNQLGFYLKLPTTGLNTAFEQNEYLMKQLLQLNQDVPNIPKITNAVCGALISKYVLLQKLEDYMHAMTP